MLGCQNEKNDPTILINMMDDNDLMMQAKIPCHVLCNFFIVAVKYLWRKDGP